MRRSLNYFTFLPQYFRALVPLVSEPFPIHDFQVWYSCLAIFKVCTYTLLVLLLCFAVYLFLSAFLLHENQISSFHRLLVRESIKIKLRSHPGWEKLWAIIKRQVGIFPAVFLCWPLKGAHQVLPWNLIIARKRGKVHIQTVQDLWKFNCTECIGVVWKLP